MDEYEMLEQELSEQFKTYFQHYRNVDYFEKELLKHTDKVKKSNAVFQARAEKRLEKERNHLVDDLAISFDKRGDQVDSDIDADNLPSGLIADSDF